MCVDVAAICRRAAHSRFIHFEVCGAEQIARSSALLYLGKRQMAELTLARKHLELG
jgi:hypothetical protein